jgi:acyl CoA:acetate/3-ketoacid CoA transferase beta subunit
MEHTAGGKPKLLKQCTLPLTGTRVVNTIITDLAVFEVTKGGLALTDIAPGVTVDELRGQTEAAFHVQPGLKVAA